MALKKSFLFNTLFTLAVNLLVKPIWVFGIDRTVQNRLGENEYGMYFAIFNFTYLFQILLDFGLQNYNQTEIAADTSRMQKMLPGMLSVKMMLSLLYVLVVFGVGVQMGYAWERFFPWLLLNQVLLSLNIFLRSNISANRLFIRDAFLSVSDKILMIALSAVMLSGVLPHLTLSIYHFVLVQTVALGMTTILCLLSVRSIETRYEWKPDWTMLRKILKESLPFAAAYFLMTLYYRIDTVMIERMMRESGALEAGIYAQSYRIMESVNNLGYLMAGVLLPLFAYRLGSTQSFLRELRHGYGLMFTMAAPIIAGGYFYADVIIGSLYPGRDAAYSAGIFKLLLLNFFPVAIMYVISPLLTAKKSFGWMLSSLTVAVVINIGLNYWLIPVQGAFGAALATLATQVFMLLSYTAALKYIFGIVPEKRLMLQSLIVLAVALISSVALSFVGLHWLPGLAIVGGLSLMSSHFSGLISKASFRLRVE